MKQASLKKFYTLLEKLPKDDYKSYESSSGIRLYKDNNRALTYCPLTAICDNELDTFYVIGAYEVAARDLGIDEATSRTIIRAVDKGRGSCKLILKRVKEVLGL